MPWFNGRAASRCSAFLLAALSVMVIGRWAQGGALMVAGSPTYDSTTGTGFTLQNFSASAGPFVNDAGMAIGRAAKYDGGNEKGTRAVQWDAGGTVATELENLGADTSGLTYVYAYAINNLGTTVGNAKKYEGGTDKGKRAVRWDATGTVTELGGLATSDTGYVKNANAMSINNTGTAVGYTSYYVDGVDKGVRAVRWDANGTAATELGNLGTSGNGLAYAYAYAINNLGTTVGHAKKYEGGADKGNRAVRWDATGTVATELGNLGTGNGYIDSANAEAVNSEGTAVGFVTKYTNGTCNGDRAVRWDANGTAATELSDAAPNNGTYISSRAKAINDAGTVVGNGTSSGNKGYRALRWDAAGTAVTELGCLGTDGNGETESWAFAINNAGTVVGYARKYDNGITKGIHAVIWLADNSIAIDLNDLGVEPSPGGGVWTLLTAASLSADGWVVGIGNFDPDGAGALPTYERLWVAQVGLGGAWTGGSGTWGRGANWSSGTPAMPVGDATFSTAANYTVALDRNELTKSVVVSNGSVTIAGNGHSLATESGLSIANGAAFKAAGSVLSNISNAGTLAADNGTLDLTGDLVNTGILEFAVAGASNYDQINLSGAFTAGGQIAVTLDGYAPVLGDQFDLMDFASLIDSGCTFDLSQASLSEGLAWDTSTFATTGSISVVPEPSTLVLLVAGIVGVLACVGRCRKRAVTGGY